MPLQPQPIPVHVLGLDGKVASKYAQAGKLDLLENGYATRRAAEDGGGIVVEKRLGTTSQSRTTTTGSITSGFKIAPLGQELLMTDGLNAYAKGSGAEWRQVGRVTDVAAVLQRVSSNQAGTGDALDCDIATCNGFVMCTSSRSVSTDARWFLRDQNGTTVANGLIGAAGAAFFARVVAVGTSFFVFSWEGGGPHLNCQKLDTTVQPFTLSAMSTVAANLGLSGALYAEFDVIVDVTNSRIVVGYLDTGPGLTLKIWNTNMTAGASVTYATHVPDKTLGFLDWTFANGNGYVAVGTVASGLWVLTFGSASMTVTVATQVDAAAVTCDRITGYFSGVNRNVFYTVTSGINSNRKIQGWTDAAGHGAFTVYRSVGLASRCFAINGRRYLLANYYGALSSKQNSLFLIDMTVDSFNGNPGEIAVSGYLVAGNLDGYRQDNNRVLGGIALVSASKAIAAFALVDSISPAGSTEGLDQGGMATAVLDWTGTLTGDPVEFNGILYIPAAAAKIYDGQTIVENGPYVFPEAPTLTPATGAGALSLTKSYEYVAVYFRPDNHGSAWQSAPSPPAIVALTGTQNQVTVAVPTLRLTEAATAYNINPLTTPWRIAVYRTPGNGVPLYLVKVLDNDVTVDSVSFVDQKGDPTLVINSLIYTDGGIVDNISPPAVLAFAVHRNRLFAINDAVWHTKEVVDGVAAQFSDSFRILFDPSGGGLTGLLSLDSTLIVAKRSRFYALTGDGPTPDGNGPYAYPAPLPGAIGMLTPRSFMMTPAGALIKSAKGMFLLDRGGTQTPVEGSNTYDALTVTGGVSLDDRPFSCMVTAEGTTIVRDWQLGQWYAWTGQAAVACCLWQNKLVLLAADGTVRVETAGTWADDGVAFTWKVRLAWLHLSQIMGFQRIWEIQVLADFLSTTTFIARLAYDNNATPTQSPQAAVTSASPSQLSIKPVKQECVALQPTFEETSTGQGVALMGLLIEAGFEPRGLRPLAASQGMT